MPTEGSKSQYIVGVAFQMMTPTNRLVGRRCAVILLLNLFVLINSSSANVRLKTASAAMQSATATLIGTVVDEKNAFITNVEVTITNAETRLQRETFTNSHGYFVVPLLPPGHYHVTAKRQ